MKSASWAAIVAGIVFMMLEMVLVGTVGGGSPWGPPRMIGAIALGSGALPPPATFDLTIMLVAMVIHFALSILLGLILGWIVSRLRLGRIAAIGAGTVFGLAVYFVSFYGFTAVFPWFAMARTPITVFAHIVFGAVLGWAYHALAAREAKAVGAGLRSSA